MSRSQPRRLGRLYLQLGRDKRIDFLCPAAVFHLAAWNPQQALLTIGGEGSLALVGYNLFSAEFHFCPCSSLTASTGLPQ